MQTEEVQEMRKTMEFFLTGAELSLNSVISANLKIMSPTRVLLALW